MFKALIDVFFDQLFIAWHFRQHFVEILFCDDLQGTGFEAFDAEQAGPAVPKAFDGGDGLPLEEELKADVFSIVVKGKPQTTLCYKIGLSGDIAFPEEDRFGRDGDLFKKMAILSPVRGEHSMDVAMSRHSRKLGNRWERGKGWTGKSRAGKGRCRGGKGKRWGGGNSLTSWGSSLKAYRDIFFPTGPIRRIIRSRAENYFFNKDCYYYEGFNQYHF